MSSGIFYWSWYPFYPFYIDYNKQFVFVGSVGGESSFTNTSIVRVQRDYGLGTMHEWIIGGSCTQNLTLERKRHETYLHYKTLSRSPSYFAKRYPDVYKFFKSLNE